MQPPHNRDAEIALCAAAWQQPDLTQTLGVQAADMYGTDTEALWHALTTLHTEGVTPDPVLVLKRIPKPLRAPVNQLLIEHIITGYTVPANAPTHAAEIRALADRRHLLTTTERLRQTLTNPEATPDQITETLAALATQPARTTGGDWRQGLTPGGTFILDTPDDTPPLWGTGGRSLWAPGEALIIAGPQGTGKTTIAQQLGLGRIGFPEYAELLDLPIAPGEKNLLYLAMDRPAQARRSLRRMVGDTWHTELNQRLTVWPGPPPRDLARNPNLLTEMCRAANADTCIVDSLKDAFLGLTDDEAAAAWNRARQTALREGIQLVELHHNRKPAAGVKSDGPTISDVYGSTWITSGAGSVILLNGQPGDPIIKLHHLKQPAEEVGPLSIVHDHDHGRSTIWHGVDLLHVVKIKGRITAQDAAALLYETDKPNPAEREKARRRLDKMTTDGLLVVLEEGGRGGDRNSPKPRTWGAAARETTNHGPITRPPSTEAITHPTRESREQQNPLSTNHATNHANHAQGPITPEGVFNKRPPGDDPTPPNERSNNPGGQNELPNLPQCTRCGYPVDPGRQLCHTCTQAEAIAYHRQRLNPRGLPPIPEPPPF